MKRKRLFETISLNVGTFIPCSFTLQSLQHLPQCTWGHTFSSAWNCHIPVQMTAVSSKNAQIGTRHGSKCVSENSEADRVIDVIKHWEGALAVWLSWLSIILCTKKVAGSIPSQGTYLSYRFDPWLGCYQSMFFSHNDDSFSLPLSHSPLLSLKSINVSLGEDFKKNTGKVDSMGAGISSFHRCILRAYIRLTHSR